MFRVGPTLHFLAPFLKNLQRSAQWEWAVGGRGKGGPSTDERLSEVGTSPDQWASLIKLTSLKTLAERHGVKGNSDKMSLTFLLCSVRPGESRCVRVDVVERNVSQIHGIHFTCLSKRHKLSKAERWIQSVTGLLMFFFHYNLSWSESESESKSEWILSWPFRAHQPLNSKLLYSSSITIKEQKIKQSVSRAKETMSNVAS